MISALGTVASAAGPEGLLALAICPDRAAKQASMPDTDQSRIVVDKLSTDAALVLLKDYLEFHDQAQAATGARAALMPWSELATRAN
jgi:hypothetical protein